MENWRIVGYLAEVARSRYEFEAKESVTRRRHGLNGRAARAEGQRSFESRRLAALNKELYSHIYSCRKTLRRLLTFVQRTVCALSPFSLCASFPILLSLFLSRYSPPPLPSPPQNPTMYLHLFPFLPSFLPFSFLFQTFPLSVPLVFERVSFPSSPPFIQSRVPHPRSPFWHQPSTELREPFSRSNSNGGLELLRCVTILFPGEAAPSPSSSSVETRGGRRSSGVN